MKRSVVLLILMVFFFTGLSAGEVWLKDADRGKAYFLSGDYDAAWLFYERALSKGCDDGQALFLAAESFRLQELPDNPRVENPGYESDLYAVASYFLQGQYPESSALREAEEYIVGDPVVNRRFLKQTYAVSGGKAPKKVSRDYFGVSSVSAYLTGFFMSRVECLMDFFSFVGAGDFKGAFSWAGANIWNLLFSILILNSLTGIILPVVMALTVAREGRKSYVTAYAFLFHWGFLGIHRFYLGRYVSGIIWLFTGGLLGIGVFFDLFLTGAYIRFWNEDHRDERPVNRPRYTGKVKKTKVRKEKVKKEKKVKPAGVSKSSGSRKASKKAKSSEKQGYLSDVDESEAFSFGDGASAVESAGIPADNFPEPSMEGSLSDEALKDEPPAMDLDSADVPGDDFDNDFGDLPDLSFDDENTDDFSISQELTDDVPLPAEEAGEELNEDEFDIKSFE